jgi:hypothetical protein
MGSLTLNEEHRFQIFGNKVLRKIFGLRRNEVLSDLFHPLLFYIAIKVGAKDCTCNCHEEYKKFIQNFGGEITWKTKNEMEV